MFMVQSSPSSCAVAICSLTQFILVIGVLGCTPEQVCASLHNSMPAVPSATPYKLSNMCVHLSLHLWLLRALMPLIALQYQLDLCCRASVLAVVHAVVIKFTTAAVLQLLTRPLLPLSLLLLHMLLLFCMGHC